MALVVNIRKIESLSSNSLRKSEKCKRISFLCRPQLLMTPLEEIPLKTLEQGQGVNPVVDQDKHAVLWLPIILTICTVCFFAFMLWIQSSSSQRPKLEIYILLGAGWLMWAILACISSVLWLRLSHRRFVYVRL
jgi:hypothetical protein